MTNLGQYCLVLNECYTGLDQGQARQEHDCEAQEEHESWCPRSFARQSSQGDSKIC